MTNGADGGSATADTRPSSSIARRIARLGVLGALGTIVLGIMMLFWPGRTLLVMAILLGIQLIVSGLTMLIARATAREGVGHTILGIIAGIGTMVLGLVVLRLPGRTLALVALFVGAAWFVSGILEAVEAIADRGSAHRAAQMLGGLVTAAAGFIILVAPLGSLLALAVWGGILMIVVGLARLVLALRVRRALRS